MSRCPIWDTLHKRASHDNFKVQGRWGVSILPHISHDQQILNVGIEDLGGFVSAQIL